MWLMVHGSCMAQGLWLMAHGSWLEAGGLWPRKIIWRRPDSGSPHLYFWRWARSLDPRALNHEPWAMNHEPLFISSRWIKPLNNTSSFRVSNEYCSKKCLGEGSKKHKWFLFWSCAKHNWSHEFWVFEVTFLKTFQNMTPRQQLMKEKTFLTIFRDCSPTRLALGF